MPENTGAEGTISGEELTQLTDLFRRFEGASDPTAVACREAEAEFNALVSELYEGKVAPRFQRDLLPPIPQLCKKSMPHPRRQNGSSVSQSLMGSTGGSQIPGSEQIQHPHRVSCQDALPFRF
jgi:hypothetical protein